MTTLVTGATGFIGSHITRQLVDRGDKVRVLLRKTSKTDNIDDLEVERIYGDILDPASIEKAVEGCDMVFHTAGYVSFRKSDYEKMNRINVEGSRNVLSASLGSGVSRVMFTSSVAAIGPISMGEKITEDNEYRIYNQNIGYMNSKYLAEKEAHEFSKKGLPVVILNPSVVIGPGDIYLSSSASILWYCKKKFPGYMDGTFNMVDVEDVARGHLLAAEKGIPGERYILGNEDLTVKEFFDIMEKITGIRSPGFKIPYWFAYVTAWLVEMIPGLSFPNYSSMDVDSVRLSRYCWHADSTKARNELGFTTKPIEESIRNTVSWFKENGYLDR